MARFIQSVFSVEARIKPLGRKGAQTSIGHSLQRSTYSTFGSNPSRAIEFEGSVPNPADIFQAADPHQGLIGVMPEPCRKRDAEFAFRALADELIERRLDLHTVLGGASPVLGAPYGNQFPCRAGVSSIRCG